MNQVMFFLCGRSGSGKDSMLRRVLELVPELKLNLPLTNRAIREGEQHGREYNFVDTDEIVDIMSTGGLFCYKVYHTYDSNGAPFDAYYGYPKPTEQFTILPGPYDVLTDIYKMRRDIPSFKFVPLYITVNHEWELLYRTIERERKNDPPRFKEVARRFCADQSVYPSNKDVERFIGEENVIYNENYAFALGQLTGIIKKIIEEEINSVF